MANVDAVTVILKEIDEVRKGIERSYTAINAIFGVIFPAALTFFIFIGKDEGKLEKPVLAFMFITLISMSFVWSQVQWMELLRYVRYYYRSLMPRLYEASGQADERDFLKWSGPRTYTEWLPMLLLYSGCLGLGVGALHIAWGGALLIRIGSVLFLIGAVFSAIAVFTQARCIEHDSQ